jgi:hypothetical protein
MHSSPVRFWAFEITFSSPIDFFRSISFLSQWQCFEFGNLTIFHKWASISKNVSSNRKSLSMESKSRLFQAIHRYKIIANHQTHRCLQLACQYCVSKLEAWHWGTRNFRKSWSDESCSRLSLANHSGVNISMGRYHWRKRFWRRNKSLTKKILMSQKQTDRKWCGTGASVSSLDFRVLRQELRFFGSHIDQGLEIARLKSFGGTWLSFRCKGSSWRK